MSPGDVLLAPLPQADGRLKDRPALLLSVVPPFGDYLVCGISTQIHNAVAGLDEIITPLAQDFEASGLKAASIIRAVYLAVLPRGYFKGRIGTVSNARHRKIVTALATFLWRSCASTS